MSEKPCRSVVFVKILSENLRPSVVNGLFFVECCGRAIKNVSSARKKAVWADEKFTLSLFIQFKVMGAIFWTFLGCKLDYRLNTVKLAILKPQFCLKHIQ